MKNEQKKEQMKKDIAELNALVEQTVEGFDKKVLLLGLKEFDHGSSFIVGLPGNSEASSLSIAAAEHMNEEKEEIEPVFIFIASLIAQLDNEIVEFIINKADELKSSLNKTETQASDVS